MQTEATFPRSTFIARSIALLAVAALALGGATFMLLRRSAEQAATAELSFNPDAAYAADSALSHSGRPAVAAAESILTDAVALDVLHTAGEVPADAAAAIAEFRSGLDLEEPSLETLRIRCRNPDPRRAAALANAVATALEGWTPPPRLAARGPTATAHAREPVAMQPSTQHLDALRSAYSTLADLEGQLASIDQRLAVLAGQPGSANRPLYPAPQTAAQAGQRRRLQAQLAAAHEALDDLRERSGGDPAIETTERMIAYLQQELGALPPPPRSGSGGEAATTGAADSDAEAPQLRLERGEIADRMAAENRTIVRLRVHPASAVAARPAQPASAQAPRFARIPAPVLQNPFRIARLASLTPRALAQPAPLATGIFALLLAAAAAFLYWRRETGAADAEDAAPEERTFTLVPAMPVAATAFAPEPVVAAPQAPPEPEASEPEDAWEAGAREPEEGWEPVAAEPEGARDIVASEPEDAWEAGGREPEDGWEPLATEPVAKTEEPIAPSSAEFSREAEVAALPEFVPPPSTTSPSETVPEAVVVPRVAEMAEIPEAARPEPQAQTAPESAPGAASKPRAESAQAGEPQAGEPPAGEPSAGEPSAARAEGVEVDRDSLVDRGRDMGDWSAIILEGLAGTSIAQKLEARHHGDDPRAEDEEWVARILEGFGRISSRPKPEAKHRSDGSNGTAGGSPDSTSEPAEARGPGGAKRE